MAQSVPITGSPEVEICPFTIELVPEVFKLYEQNRSLLSKYRQDINDEFPTIQSLFDSFAKGMTPDRERFVITAHGSLAGQLDVVPEHQDDGSVNDCPKAHELYLFVSGDEQFQRRGIGSAATLLVVKKMLLKPNVSEVFAHVNKYNTPAKKLLIQAGFIEDSEEPDKFVITR